MDFATGVRDLEPMFTYSHFVRTTEECKNKCAADWQRNFDAPDGEPEVFHDAGRGFRPRSEAERDCQV